MSEQIATDGGRRPGVAVVVTSCRRFDLLERTLRSFLTCNDYPLDMLIVIEDSDDDGVYSVEPLLAGTPHRILLNGTNIGQIASIDRAYAEVEAEYIFHIEDDWEFSEAGIIARSIEILEQEPQAIIVTCRDDADMPRYVRSLKTCSSTRASYKLAFPELHFLWHTFTFNPGLRRTADYRAIGGGYAALGDEASISRYYKASNRDMAWMIGGGVRHLGDERSTYGSGWGYRKSASRASLRRFFTRKNLHKWRESLRRRFWHMLRQLGIDTEPLQRRKGD